MISMNWNFVCRVVIVRAMACMCPSTGVVVSKKPLVVRGCGHPRPPRLVEDGRRRGAGRPLELDH